MNILQLAALKEKQEREAKKWVSYLATCATDEERVKELTRKLTETWLEGRTFVDEGQMPR